jgi:hypothetical protein
LDEVDLHEAEAANALSVGRPGTLAERLDDADEPNLATALAGALDGDADGLCGVRSVVDGADGSGHVIAP